MVEISHLLVILGPTATGKTELAVKLARDLNGEIISADSRQVYKGLDIGTGKDLALYSSVQPSVKYHLIDICSPGETYNTYRFKHDFLQVAQDIESRGKLPILCGGTGLYIEAVLLDYEFFPAKPDDALRTQLKLRSNESMVEQLEQLGFALSEEDRHNRHRLMRKLEVALRSEDKNYFLSIGIKKSLVIGVKLERARIREKISQRLEKRLQEGMIEEVQHILQQGISVDWLMSLGLEYKYITLFLQGQLTYDEMKKQLETAIHRFAKRQETWFRRMEKRGITIHWFNPEHESFEQLLEKIKILWLNS
jgi:tRNA dimethylallyltransferase